MDTFRSQVIPYDLASVCSTIFKLNKAKHPQLFTVGKATKSVPNININEGQPHASLPCKRTKMFQVPIIPTDDPFARNRLHHYTGATTHRKILQDLKWSMIYLDIMPPRPVIPSHGSMYRVVRC